MPKDPHLVHHMTKVAGMPALGLMGGPSDPLAWPSNPLFGLETLPTKSGRDALTGKSPWEDTPHFAGCCNTGPELTLASVKAQRRC